MTTELLTRIALPAIVLVVAWVIVKEVIQWLL